MDKALKVPLLITGIGVVIGVGILAAIELMKHNHNDDGGTSDSSGSGSGGGTQTPPAKQTSQKTTNAPGWDVTSGALPTNYNQAQQVILDPNSTQAQQDAANTIIAEVIAGGTGNPATVTY